MLCYVTDRRALPIANPADSLAALTQTIAKIAAAGVDWLQVREKDLPAKQVASLTRQALDIAAKLPARRETALRILVNDRLDVAIAERASGVHLGEQSLPVAEGKRLIESAMQKGLVDKSFLIGVSCHSIEAAETAQRDGANYIFFGPIFTTPSKERFGAAQGTECLQQVCRALSIPVLAIGGISTDNANSCVQAGAAGLAAIRLFQGAIDPVLTVRQLH